MAQSRAVAGAIDTAAPKPSFNWVIPIALVVPAVRYMQARRIAEMEPEVVKATEEDLEEIGEELPELSACGQ
jgi:hypothetical protein